MSSRQSNHVLYSGTTLARIALANETLRINNRDPQGLYASTDPDGHHHPVLHGVIVADGGTLYTYTRGDHGGLAETVETVVGAKLQAHEELSDWLHDITSEQPPHPDVGTELAPCVEDSLVDTSPTEDFLARMNAPVIPDNLAKLVDRVVHDAENMARQKMGLPKVDGRSKGNNRRYGPRFDHDKAMRMVEYGMRRTHIARHLGVTDQHVGKIALARGVTVKPAIKGSRKWDRFAAYEEVKAGDSFGAVGRRHDVNPESIAKMVRYIDGETR